MASGSSGAAASSSSMRGPSCTICCVSGRQYDIVVDCENGIPFFTPLYVRKPIVCLMHHVHQDVFFRSLPKPLAWFASFLEKNLMPLIYSNVLVRHSV